VLAGARRRASLLGGYLRLAAVPPQVDRVMRRTGLHRHLGAFPTVQAAMASPQVPLHGARWPVTGQFAGLGQAA
jgi:anti-anti-sigma regulatory factor